MISVTYINNILETLVGYDTSLVAPSKLYLGLSSTDLNDDGTGFTEPTAASYKRTLVGGTEGKSTALMKFGSASGGVISNKTEITCTTAREPWGVLPYWFLTSSETPGSGTAILWGTLSGAIAETGVAAETIPVFYEGDLKASINKPLE